MLSEICLSATKTYWQEFPTKGLTGLNAAGAVAEAGGSGF